MQAELAALIAEDDAPGAGEQLTLEVFDVFGSPIDRQMSRRGVEFTRGPGRPEGSKTRAKLDIVRLIRATKRPTLLALKDLADLDLDEFVVFTGITDRAKAFAEWRQIAEFVTKYEEGLPIQRVDLTSGGEVMRPVVVFGDVPVRPDLVEGNAPDDARLIEATDWTVSENDMEDGQGSPPKAHDDDESQ